MEPKPEEQEYCERRRREAIFAGRFLGWTEVEQNSSRLWLGKSPTGQRGRPPFCYESLNQAWLLMNAVVANDSGWENVLDSSLSVWQLAFMSPGEAAKEICDCVWSIVEMQDEID